MKKAIVLLLVFLASTAYAEIYYWTDDNGIKHFSNTPVPPENAQTEERGEIEHDARQDASRGAVEEADDRQPKDRSNAEKEAVNRGNDAAVATGCYESAIVSPAPFMGNNGEMFKLSDGSIWEVKNEYQYMYAYYPMVIVCPSKGKIAIKGKTLNVQRVGGSEPIQRSNTEQGRSSDEVIESRIDGEFSGWEGETIFKLTNGQVWQQVDGRYTYTYRYSPEVLIFRSGSGYEMQVEGVDGRVRISRLK